MNLSEGLDELRVGILRDTSTLKNGPPDKYWTDDRLVKYIDEAHKRFARLTFCIRDDITPQATQIVLGDGTLNETVPKMPNFNADVYTLDPSVMAVLSARHQDDYQDMVRIKRVNVANTQNTFTEDFEFALSTSPGKPVRFSTDEGLDPTQNHAIRMRFFGTPDATQVGKIVYLRVIRMPLGSLSMDDTSAVFETPDEYSLDVLEWAAYRALRNWDIDAEDRTKAEQHKKRFEEAVKECKRDVLRKIFQPLGWRFGGNGFSYIHN